MIFIGFGAGSFDFRLVAPGPGPPLPKPQARKASDVPASRSLRHFHFQRPPNLDRGGVVVMSNDPADRELALLVRHLTDSGRHQKVSKGIRR